MWGNPMKMTFNLLPHDYLSREKFFNETSESVPITKFSGN